MQAWSLFLDTIEEQLGAETTTKWLRSLKVIHFDAGNLYLEAESSFQVDWFEEHIRARAKKTFVNNNFRPIKIHLTCATQEIHPPSSDQEKTASSPSFTLAQDPLLPEYQEKQYIFSAENAILQQLLAQTASPTPPTFNPIFLYGPSCSGKTHLLQAFAHAMSSTHQNVLYVHAQTFTENLVRSIRSGHMQQFRHTYRFADVLIIDDIQYLERKAATQEEFFHTFNHLHNQNKQIILSANTPPGMLQNIEPRLISRFEWGLSLPIIKLEKEQLFTLIEQRSQQLQINLTESSKRFLLEEFGANPKSLQKALNAIYLRASSYQRALSPPKIQVILKDLIEEERREILTPEKITHIVSDFYDLRPEDILGKSQRQECTTPRQIAMFFCRTTLKMPYTKIGAHFGRDHSTVITSVRGIKEKIQVRDSSVATAISTLQQKMQ